MRFLPWGRGGRASATLKNSPYKDVCVQWPDGEWRSTAWGYPPFEYGHMRLAPEMFRDEQPNEGVIPVQESTAIDDSPSPRLGNIVHYVLPSQISLSHAGEHRPAIIVKVWSAGDWNIQLQVFMDGTNDWDGGPCCWATSVRYDEAGAEGTWHWPESDLITTPTTDDENWSLGDRQCSNDPDECEACQ